MSEMVFLHHLAAAPTVTVREGQRVLALMVGEDNASRTIPSAGLDPDSILDKGTFAYMLRKACRLPRSLNEVILVDKLGLGDRRYALKTCMYEGLMPYGRAADPITGGEILSALTAAENGKSCQVAADPQRSESGVLIP